MNSTDQLARDLTDWFAETAMPSQPDDIDDILRATAGIRQRPRWTFLPLLSRPMRRPIVGLPASRAAPNRVVFVLFLIGLLLVGLAMVFGGSPPRLPPPFGAAANGLVAYEEGGHIFTADPATGERRAISAGGEPDHDPRWSLDGESVAYLRGSNPDRLVVAGRSGTVRMITADRLVSVDGDSIAWSPDGRTIALAAGPDGRRAIYLVDAIDGRVTILPVDYWSLEVLWRPPDGRELLFIGGNSGRNAFFRYSLADRTVTEVAGTSVVAPSADSEAAIRPIGWTPDGARFAFHRVTPTLRGSETVVIDIRTGSEVVLPLGFGRISNDGRRIVGFDTDGQRDWLCVAPTTGGACIEIQGDASTADGGGFASLQWAPDDQWIRAETELGPVALLDPNGGPMLQPEWGSDGGASWQRRAP
jgi:hypothetical protein